MNPPLLTHAVSWDTHLERIFIIVREASSLMLTYSELPEVEEVPGKPNTLNRLLNACIEDVVEAKGPAFQHHLPEYGGPNERGKIPDFRWKLMDHAEGKKRFFDLECKRLGMRSDHSSKYVKNGLMRFVSETHRYGDDQDCGGMVGYVQGMNLASILNKINKIVQDASVSPLVLVTNEWNENGVTELNHLVTRSFPINPLKLSHFWVDCRAIYIAQKKAPNSVGQDKIP